MVATLDDNLRRFAACIRTELGIEVETVPGSGAAGGMGAALQAFLGAQLRPGINIVMEAAGLDAAVRDADLVITGEGRIDSQTVQGKAPIGVARVAKRYGRPVIAIAGSVAVDAGVVHRHGIDAVFSVLCRVGTLEEAMAQAAENVRVTARNIAACFKAGM
jgi:glycerate kinase